METCDPRARVAMGGTAVLAGTRLGLQLHRLPRGVRRPLANSRPSPRTEGRGSAVHPPMTSGRQRAWPAWPDAGQGPISEDRRQAWRTLTGHRPVPPAREARGLAPPDHETGDPGERRGWWGTRGRRPPPRKQLAVRPTARATAGSSQGLGRVPAWWPEPPPVAGRQTRRCTSSAGGHGPVRTGAATWAEHVGLNVSPRHSPPRLPSPPGCLVPPGRRVPEGVQQASWPPPQCPAGRAQLPCQPSGLMSHVPWAALERCGPRSLLTD